MGRAARIATYFRVMFPPHVNLPALALLFYGFYAIAQVTGAGAVRIGTDSLFGFATVVLSYLLMRLADELKDEGVDPEVFPDRPLVTGAVRYDDVRVLLLAAVVLVVALNVGRGPATGVYLVWFALFVLSWQWWLFPERVSRSFWLTFLTHQTLVPTLFAYVYAVYVHTSGAPIEPRTAALLCALYWIPMFTWEIARKVRAPEEETSYLTYTRRWGTRRAAAIPLGCVMLACTAMVSFGAEAGFTSGFAALHLAGALAVGGAMGSFLRRPRRGALLVRAPAEAYLFVFYASALLEGLLFRRTPWLS